MADAAKSYDQLTPDEQKALIKAYNAISDPQLKAEFYHENMALYSVFSQLNHPPADKVAAAKQVRLASIAADKSAAPANQPSTPQPPAN